MTVPDTDLRAHRAALVEQLDGVERELMVAHLDRTIWNEMRDEIASRFPNADGTFLSSLSRMYAQSQAMRVRRLADDHDDRPHSLWHTVDAVIRSPRLGSWSLLHESIDDDTLPEIVGGAQIEWSQRFGTDDTPDVEWLRALHQRLSDAAETVTEFVDKNIAHRDPNRHDYSLTFGELERSIDDVADVANEITRLFRGTFVGYGNFWTEGDWHEPFRPSLFPLGFGAFDTPHPAGFT